MRVLVKQGSTSSQEIRGPRRMHVQVELSLEERWRFSLSFSLLARAEREWTILRKTQGQDICPAICALFYSGVLGETYAALRRREKEVWSEPLLPRNVNVRRRVWRRLQTQQEGEIPVCISI